MKVLLSNDDGIEAIGLVSLAKALVKAGVDLRVSAPGTNQSAMAHKMTCKEKIRVERYNFPEEELRSVKVCRRLFCGGEGLLNYSLHFFF